MGTRNLTCVYYEGKYKIAQYGQWDGYPSGQGETILEFILKQIKIDGVELNKFKQRIKTLEFLNQSDFENIDKELEEKGLENQWTSIYPYLSRDMGAEILDYIMEHENIKLKDSIDFANDSLFCEWCYVIDLDKDVLEIYEGFNHKPIDKTERFYNNGHMEIKSDKEYYPVRFIKSYNFYELTSETMKELESEINKND